MGIIETIWNLRTPYLSEQAAKAIVRYKYAGYDASLLNYYLWSPMADALTEYVPRYVAYFYH